MRGLFLSAALEKVKKSDLTFVRVVFRVHSSIGFLSQETLDDLLPLTASTYSLCH